MRLVIKNKMKGFLFLLSLVATIVLGLMTVDRLLGPTSVAKASSEANPAAVIELAAAPNAKLAVSPPVTAPIFGVPIMYSRTFTRNGVPVQGDRCQFQFSLWDSMTDGQPQGKPYISKRIKMRNGVLLLKLPLEDAYRADSRWLQVEARCGDERSYSVFGPRYLVRPEEYGMVGN